MVTPRMTLDSRALPPMLLSAVRLRVELSRQLAVAALPETSLASITVVHDGHPYAVACTARRAQRLDAAQYREGTGPCVDALTSGVATQAQVTEIRTHWPAFARTARREHVHSFLALPLQDIDGTLSLYGASSHALDTLDGRRLTPLARLIGRRLTEVRLPPRTEPTDVRS